MKIRHCLVTAFAVALFACVSAQAQNHTRFDDHDRQVTQDWYNTHQKHPVRGMRTQDRLSAEQEATLAEGKPLSRDLRRHAYAAPSDLTRHLAKAPRHHKYMVVGGHVVLVDQNYVVNDVIHLHEHH
jgi:Ni/Co efflux regulator RcnB